MFRKVSRAALSGQFMMVDGPSTSGTLVTTDGQLYVLPFDLAAPATIDQTLAEVVTTPGGAGSVTRAGWWRDDGTNNRPGQVLVDLGTVDTTTTGLKTWAQTVGLPAGRVWVGIVAQGAASPAPTVRSRAIAQTSIGLPSMSSLTSQFLATNGGAVPGALGNAPAFPAVLQIAPGIAVRFA